MDKQNSMLFKLCNCPIMVWVLWGLKAKSSMKLTSCWSMVLFWFHLLAKLAWKESRRNNLLKLTKPLLKEYSPLKTKVYDEEYLITDGITLIGSVVGTLGLFIGASNSSAMYSIMDFLKSSIVSHFSRKWNKMKPKKPYWHFQKKNLI